MKKNSVILKRNFLISAGKKFKNEQKLIEITDKLFSVIEHELGVTKREICSKTLSHRLIAARTHFAVLAIEAGIEEKACAYFMHKMEHNIQVMIENHKVRMETFSDPYKKDHEEILSYMKGTGPGLCRGIKNQFTFSVDEFYSIFNRIQTHKGVLDKICDSLRKLSNVKKANYFNLQISQRELEDLISGSGICRKNINEIVEHLNMFAT